MGRARSFLSPRWQTLAVSGDTVRALEKLPPSQAPALNVGARAEGSGQFLSSESGKEWRRQLTFPSRTGSRNGAGAPGGGAGGSQAPGAARAGRGGFPGDGAGSPAALLLSRTGTLPRGRGPTVFVPLGFDLCEVGQEEVILKTGKQANRRTMHFALQSLLALFGKRPPRAPPRHGRRHTSGCVWGRGRGTDKYFVWLCSGPCKSSEQKPRSGELTTRAVETGCCRGP